MLRGRVSHRGGFASTSRTRQTRVEKGKTRRRAQPRPTSKIHSNPPRTRRTSTLIEKEYTQIRYTRDYHLERHPSSRARSRRVSLLARALVRAPLASARGGHDVHPAFIHRGNPPVKRRLILLAPLARLSLDPSATKNQSNDESFSQSVPLSLSLSLSLSLVRRRNRASRRRRRRRRAPLIPRLDPSLERDDVALIPRLETRPSRGHVRFDSMRVVECRRRPALDDVVATTTTTTTTTTRRRRRVRAAPIECARWARRSSRARRRRDVSGRPRDDDGTRAGARATTTERARGRARRRGRRRWMRRRRARTRRGTRSGGNGCRGGRRRRERRRRRGTTTTTRARWGEIRRWVR